MKNTQAYLPDCLQSIRKQSFEDFELIAINDHSTDRSASILMEAAAADPRILVMNNEGEGIVDALRMAFRHSRGTWIHRMDSDDVMPEAKLERLMAHAERGKVVTGKVSYFSDWLVGLGFKNYEHWINSLMDKGSLWEDIYMECPLPSPAWLAHRDDLAGVGAFDGELLPEDYDLCFRFYKHGFGVNTIPSVIHLWRDHQVRTTRKVPAYFPKAYYPLKLRYFLEIDRDPSKPLILWGAGKKGKLLAGLLSEAGEDFYWVTDNERKVGVDIYGHLIGPVTHGEPGKEQRILAVAAPEGKLEIQEKLDRWGLQKAADYWWFC